MAPNSALVMVTDQTHAMVDIIKFNRMSLGSRQGLGHLSCQGIRTMPDQTRRRQIKIPQSGLDLYALIGEI
jgi:hypothetical protein